MSGGSDNDTVTGGSGDDVVRGGRGDDILRGDSGNDKVLGGQGNDIAYGGEGDDIVNGGAGNDQLFGGKGNDKMIDGAGDDYVDGDSGNDLFIAHNGNDTYIGGSGIDTLDFRRASESVEVSLFDKSASADGEKVLDGIENVSGSRHDDSFDGDKRDNTFVGRDGDDTFRGRGGEDTFKGGRGEDTYIWQSKDVLDSDGEHLGVDTILDFNKSHDTLDLTGLGEIDVENLEETLVATTTDEGTMISAYMGDDLGFQDVVLLQNRSGIDVATLVDDGTILV